MKVAYNNCFGGFGLSPKALTEFAKRKGVSLTWYKQVGYKHNNDDVIYTKVEDIDSLKPSFSLYASTVDLGEDIESVPSGVFYYPDFDELRTDKDLIDVIEHLGDEANGSCASLSIAEIPDGASYEITYYDGNESVEPPRVGW